MRWSTWAQSTAQSHMDAADVDGYDSVDSAKANTPAWMKHCPIPPLPPNVALVNGVASLKTNESLLVLCVFRLAWTHTH